MNAMTQSAKTPSSNKTESVFDLLVEMIGDVSELISCPSDDQRSSNYPVQAGSELVGHTGDTDHSVSTIHYMEGSFRGTLTATDIAERVINQPHSRHLVWTQGMSTWKVWSSLPEVVDAIKVVLSNATAQRSVKTTERPAPVLNERPHQPAAPSMKPAGVTPPQSGPTSAPPAPIAAEVVSLSMDLTQRDMIQFYRGFHDDLSDGGLFVRTELRLEPGQRVEVSLNMGKNQPALIVEGLVSWVRYKSDHADRLGNGVGVYLTDTTTAHQTLAAAFNPNLAIFYAA